MPDLSGPLIMDAETFLLGGGASSNEPETPICVYTSGASSVALPKFTVDVFLRYATGVGGGAGVGGWLGYVTTVPSLTGVQGGTLFFVGGNNGMSVRCNIKINANIQLYYVTNGVVTAGFGFYVPSGT